MASLTVNGNEVKLRFDVYTLERIEEEFGSFSKMMDAMKDVSTKRILRVVTIMAESQLDYEGKEPKLDRKILAAFRHMSVSAIKDAGDAIRAAIEEGQETETTGGGPADDETHDAFLEEIESKN